MYSAGTFLIMMHLIPLEISSPNSASPVAICAVSGSKDGKDEEDNSVKDTKKEGEHKDFNTKRR